MVHFQEWTDVLNLFLGHLRNITNSEWSDLSRLVEEIHIKHNLIFPIDAHKTTMFFKHFKGNFNKKEPYN